MATRRKAARDWYRTPIYVGDTVRRIRRGSDVIHWTRRSTLPLLRVDAIGQEEHVRGLIQVDGVWESPAQFEKVAQ